MNDICISGISIRDWYSFIWSHDQFVTCMMMGPSHTVCVRRMYSVCVWERAFCWTDFGLSYYYSLKSWNIVFWIKLIRCNELIFFPNWNLLVIKISKTYIHRHIQFSVCNAVILKFRLTNISWKITKYQVCESEAYLWFRFEEHVVDDKFHDFFSNKLISFRNSKQFTTSSLVIKFCWRFESAKSI